MNILHSKAYAKINLGLDVTGVLDKGYHLVKMIMQTVDLYDDIDYEIIDSGIEVSSDIQITGAPADNLVYRAADLLLNEFSINGGIRIHITKRIPMAAGLAGGSSDAAATLKAVNILYDLGLSQEELMRLGVKLGADIPYCLLGGTALAEGIGEVLTPLVKCPECAILLAKPDISVSTAYVYNNLQLDSVVHPDIDGIKKAIVSRDLSGMAALCGNVLESVTEKQYPVITDIKKAMLENGARTSLMSGSGPTVFGIFDDIYDARRALPIVHELARDCFAVTLI